MSRRLLNIYIFLTLLAAASGMEARAAGLAPGQPPILEDSVVYLRASQVAGGKLKALVVADEALIKNLTNKVAGVILDLRFAQSDDYADVQPTTQMLAGKKLPLVILVNEETQGAAVQLAAALRQAGLGLILGNPTLPEKNGDQTFPGVRPDITVAVLTEDERMYSLNPYAALPLNETNSRPATNLESPFVDHTSEADLVRAKIKDGEQDENPLPPRPSEPKKPVIHDPVLARAVDLLKALAIIRPSRS